MFEGVPSLDLYDSNGTARASLSIFDDGPALDLFNSKGKLTTMVSDNLISVDAGNSNYVGLSADGEPNLEISDSQGFEARLGVTTTVTTLTGEQHETSAASLTLFGKDKKVLWSAP
jgi:hypothetical protein